MSGPRVSRDTALLHRVADGDEHAWETLDARYRRRLRRYAASLSRPGAVDPDDVVQDVLVRAHAVLREGFAPDRLGPWLYRLARNATIDELRRRTRRPEVPIDDHAGLHDREGTPEMLVLRRERLRRLTEDIAELPDAQRHALLAHAVDGRPVAEIADELGVSAPSVHMSIQRARTRLVRAEDARDAECLSVRPLLHTAHERGARPPENARLHLQTCSACRGYRRDLRRVDRRLQALAPPVLPLLGLAGGASQLGVGTKTAALAGVVAVSATGGLIVQHRTLGAGQPAPATLVGRDLLGGTVRRGQPLPTGMAVIRTTVRIEAGRPPDDTPRTVTVTCPAGSAFSGFVPGRGRPPLRYGLGHDERATLRSHRIFFAATPLPRPAIVRLDVICRPADRTGSQQRRPRRARPGEVAARACRGDHYLVDAPSARGVFRGTLGAQQPVSIQRLDPSGDWARVVSDAYRVRGWIRRAELCGP